MARILRHIFFGFNTYKLHVQHSRSLLTRKGARNDIRSPTTDFSPFRIRAGRRLTLSVSAYSLTLQPLPPRCGRVCFLPNDYTEEELSRDMSHVPDRAGQIWQESCLFGCVRGYNANQSLYGLMGLWNFLHFADRTTFKGGGGGGPRQIFLEDQI